MYGCVCICMYIEIFICICLYLYWNVCICMFMFVNICICMFVYVQVCICMCMYVYVFVCICMYMYVFVYACMFVCVYFCLSVCLHARTYVCVYLVYRRNRLQNHTRSRLAINRPWFWGARYCFVWLKWTSLEHVEIEWNRPVKKERELLKSCGHVSGRMRASNDSIHAHVAISGDVATSPPGVHSCAESEGLKDGHRDHNY
jgi:hypothetical protein